ncbi:MAG: hypothetical protein ACAH12_03450 [Methylophilaceae bacterium]
MSQRRADVIAARKRCEAIKLALANGPMDIRKLRVAVAGHYENDMAISSSLSYLRVKGVIKSKKVNEGCRRLNVWYLTGNDELEKADPDISKRFMKIDFDALPEPIRAMFGYIPDFEHQAAKQVSVIHTG